MHMGRSQVMMVTGQVRPPSGERTAHQGHAASLLPARLRSTQALLLRKQVRLSAAAAKSRTYASRTACVNVDSGPGSGSGSSSAAAKPSASSDASASSASSWRIDLIGRVVINFHRLLLRIGTCDSYVCRKARGQGILKLLCSNPSPFIPLCFGNALLNWSSTFMNE
ncbi:hypothetical protein VOLCADRAFT_95288 [Volvox carteri f. nagariensis]|uniref:Uncharacterized protein n=1 Tax=Volvox carteri f. nagariensis TaxID=3068 RepID=D8U736_VOLCA|nr:uncharacterized protein VOLCADRAFT_95288 [Volvox carteri f. nagariensis]EFJ44360.1 hypothetical protein VOLCADRAFT_95288 [Volvox carteri f. nagariensis]|eukprot:XP_002954467.1 hypothetical protein VOLCADRAFT_95288 [Volvox carteri f. nagariensis]